MNPPDHEAELRRLTQVFLEENKKLNLSALRTEDACWIGNVLDSLPLLDLSLMKDASNILDLGTGGGFPLLPLAIECPEKTFTGVDSVKKKIDAVARIVDQLELKNVTLISERAEVLGNDPTYREQFDVVTARAVAEIPVLLEYMSPFTKVGGHIVLWKSLKIDEELKTSEKAQQEFRCLLMKQYRYELPGDFGSRQLLIFKKTGPLAKKYPREVGVAKKTPLT